MFWYTLCIYDINLSFLLCNCINGTLKYVIQGRYDRQKPTSMAFCNFAKKEINVSLSNFKLKSLYKVQSLITLFRRKDKKDRIYVLHSYITSCKCSVCDFITSILSIKWIEIYNEQEFFRSYLKGLEVRGHF